NENNIKEIENISGYGYKLVDETKQKLNGLDENIQNNIFPNNLDKTDRISEIIWLLVSNQDNVSIIRLAEEYQCSRNTIIKDYKEINQRFNGIKIISTNQGRRITNSERFIRLLIYELLQRNNQCIKNHVKNLGYDWDSYYK